jgi:hypothetical protein
VTKLRAFTKRIHNIDWAAVWNSPWAVFTVFAICTVLFGLMLPAIQLGTWNDDATYVTMAQSLLQGKGLSLVYFPTDPVYPVVPFGYPLALAPLIYFFPNVFLPLKLLSSVLLLIAIVLVHRWVGSREGKAMALLVAALFGTNVAIVQSAAQVMSESLFIVCVLGAILQVERFVALEQANWQQVLWTAFVIGLPLNVRYLGLPIVAALMLYILWRKRNLTAIGVVALSLTILIALNLGIGGAGVARYYIDRISGFVSRIITPISVGAITSSSTKADDIGYVPQLFKNLAFLLTYSIPGILVPLFNGPRIQELFRSVGLGGVPVAIQLGIDGLLVLGFALQIRRKAHVSDWVVFCYATTLFLLPTNWETLPSRFRYWIPLIPFGYFYLLTALQAIHKFLIDRIQWLPQKTRPIGLVVIVITTCMLLVNLGRDIQESLLNPLHTRVPDLTVGSEWINTHTDPNDVIMVQLPRVSALYLQREVVGYPYNSWENKQIYSDTPVWQDNSSDGLRLERALANFEVDYLMITPALVPDQPLHWNSYVANTLLPVLKSCPEKFFDTWKSEDGFTIIYEVTQGVTCLDG